MPLNQDIDQHLIQALKDKDQLRVAVLRMLKSVIHNHLIAQKKSELVDKEVLAVIRKELKKRQDSIESFKQGGRNDLVKQEQEEAEILSNYLPAMLTEAEVTKIVDEVIASGVDNFGQAMKEVMTKTQGQADGKLIQELVKAKLNN